MPSVVSTFAGCGGSSLGYKMAGFRELLATDWDENSEEVFRLNFPDVPFMNSDIGSLSPEDVLNAAGISKGELDVLDGSPPCQGFSTAGKRRVNDPRNDLFKEFVRLVEGIQPKAFVMENVSGQAKGRMKGRFVEIVASLRACGYDVKIRQLNAANYGVPQARQRIFYVGFRNDIAEAAAFEFPAPAGNALTAGDACANADTAEHYMLSQKALFLWHKLRPGENGSRATPGAHFNFIKVNPAKPSPTVVKTFHSHSGLFHWAEPRSLSIGELKRVCSFPDGFQFTGSFQDKWARLGNAVMPLQMKAVAESVRSALERAECGVQ